MEDGANSNDAISNTQIISVESQRERLGAYCASQELIDDILSNELKDFVFPVKPIYNSRIRANGHTKAELYSWGSVKRIIKIEIGKQDSEQRDFLVDTLLHEYYEALILKNSSTEDFYKKLHESTEILRHAWINNQISKFFIERNKT